MIINESIIKPIEQYHSEIHVYISMWVCMWELLKGIKVWHLIANPNKERFHKNLIKTIHLPVSLHEKFLLIMTGNLNAFSIIQNLHPPVTISTKLLVSRFDFVLEAARWSRSDKKLPGFRASDGLCQLLRLLRHRDHWLYVQKLISGY